MILDKLFLLFAGHLLADFPLQDDHMAKTKNRHYKPDYIPEGQKPTPIWFYSLTAHALIHGLVVYVITGRLGASLQMSVNHWILDFLKCENITNPHVDQLLHYIMIFIIWMGLTQSGNSEIY